jgi:uncharacterized protein YjiS (DUF1127 family)
MIALGIGVTPLGRSPHWSKLTALFAEWWRRAQSRYDLERLSERDLADMRLRLDALDEMQNCSGSAAVADAEGRAL